MKEKKNVLILGGNGFIGSNLSIMLLKNGYQVTSFDRVLPQSKVDGINYEEGDFFDDDVLRMVIKEKDIVYHAISTINPGNSNTVYMRGYKKDFIQSVKLCELIRDYEARLIFLSSGGTVYGFQDKQPIEETALPRPINHYGNIKLCIENTILAFEFQNNMNAIIARISNPYGPGQDYQKGVGFIDAAIRNALSGNTIEVWGDGNVIRDYIYIDDVCVALSELAGIETKNIPIYNISSGRGVSLNYILEVLRSIHGEIKVDYKNARSVDLEKVILSNERIKELVNRPFYKLEEGIHSYYNYIKQSRWKQ